ncbi:hypothetical protein [Carboxylicivirga marina]|uniref:hypothetical protein n=1 Tax=Carboxylicivirga marina TaxID=2800988 RepID=UPI00259532E3|nr:hypothetical protein [uncultured Carboxylicivirga sp.]
MGNKLVVIALLMMSLIACNTNGQQRKRASAEDMAKHQTEMMEKSLDLSSEQSKTVSELNLKYAEKFKKIKEEAGGDREKMRTLRGELLNKKNDELKEVLSEEQFEKYIKLEEERAKEMRNGRRGGRGER